MDNYNFNIKQMLDKYNNDPEKLANAFADALNDELAKQRDIEYIDCAAADVSDAWQNFVTEYFKKNDLPRGVDEESFYIAPETVKILMDMCIRAVPYMSLFQEYLSKLEAISNEIIEKVPTVTQKAEEDFSNVMARFFQKNDIG